jgi:flavin reductase (DIM6/NTAB) family NADH-FMN oxidoreductase RutF
VTDDAFHDIAATLDYPVLIVTAAAHGERSGCLVGFHTQCSIDPPRWLVCISTANHTSRVAHDADALVVHVLREGQEPLARLFGHETGDDVDKFAQCAWHPIDGGLPVIDGCDWVSGAILERIELGDHTGFLLSIDDARTCHRGTPQLGFQRLKGMEPGHDA